MSILFCAPKLFRKIVTEKYVKTYIVLLTFTNSLKWLNWNVFIRKEHKTNQEGYPIGKYMSVLVGRNNNEWRSQLNQATRKYLQTI